MFEIQFLIKGWVDFWQAGHPLLHLHEVLTWEVFPLLAPLQIPGASLPIRMSSSQPSGDGQLGDALQADLLHSQPWRPHPIQPRPHCVHWFKEVASKWKCQRVFIVDQGGSEIQGSTSRWLTSAPLQGLNLSGELFSTLNQVSPVEVLPLLAKSSEQT